MENKFPLDQITAHFKSVLDKAPRELGVDALNFFLDSFTKQGWQGATFQAWPARKAGGWGNKLGSNSGRSVLVKSARLKRSLRITFADNTKSVIGTDVPYAKAHNEGFNGLVKQSVKPFTRANGQQVKGFQRTIHQNIPQRRYMGQSPILTAQLKRTLENKLMMGLPQS